MAKCKLCGKEGLGEIINADGKHVLTEYNMFGETAHSLTCPCVGKGNK